MAEAITIACPECQKKITAPAAAVGKKVRCKACDHVFVIDARAARAPGAGRPGEKGKPPAAKAAAKPAKPADDDEDSNPYGVTELDTAPRCPECANELESEDAVICLTCGYNTRTRSRVVSRAVEDTTGGIWFWWLAPGIGAALATLILFTLDIWYTIKIGDYVADSWYEFISYAPFKLWGVWAPSILIMVGCVTFAVKRLILHPRPPEKEKRKKRKEADV